MCSQWAPGPWGLRAVAEPSPPIQTCCSDEERGKLQRSMGLKMEQLKVRGRPAAGRKACHKHS